MSFNFSPLLPTRITYYVIQCMTFNIFRNRIPACCCRFDRASGCGLWFQHYSLEAWGNGRREVAINGMVILPLFDPILHLLSFKLMVFLVCQM